MAWPPDGYPFSAGYTNQTPNANTHPALHNAIAEALNDLVVKINLGVEPAAHTHVAADITDLAAAVATIVADTATTTVEYDVDDFTATYDVPSDTVTISLAPGVGGGAVDELGDVGDVTITGLAARDFIVRRGSAWVNLPRPLHKVSFHDSMSAWGNAQSGTVFAGNSSRNIWMDDLRSFEQVRLRARVSSVGAAAQELVLRYFTSYSTTVGDYLDIGTSAVEVALGSTGEKLTSWIDLAAGAKAADVRLALIQTGGDGATTPAIGPVTAYFR